MAEVLVISNVEVACAIIALSLPCLQFLIPEGFITRMRLWFGPFKAAVKTLFEWLDDGSPDRLEKGTPPQGGRKQGVGPSALRGKASGASRDSQTDTLFGSRAPGSISVKRSLEIKVSNSEASPSHEK